MVLVIRAVASKNEQVGPCIARKARAKFFCYMVWERVRSQTCTIVYVLVLMTHILWVRVRLRQYITRAFGSLVGVARKTSGEAE